MNAAAIRGRLRGGHTEELEKRRVVILLSTLGLLDFSVITLYQAGVIRKLPDIPSELFDSNKVNASDSAYAMGVPDGAISTLMYALILVLASVKGTKLSGRKKIHDTLLGGAVAANAAGAAYYLYDMIFRQKKACIYCLAGAAINLTSAAIIYPLLRRKLRKLSLSLLA